MSGLFNKGKGNTDFKGYGPVWIGTCWTAEETTGGEDMTTGKLVCPVPFDYYKVLGVSLAINVRTAYSNTSVFRLQAVKPSSGAVSTTPFTCDSAAIALNAAGVHVVRMWSPDVSRAAAARSGYIKCIPGTTGAAFTATGAAAISGNGGICSTITDATLTNSEYLPEVIQVTALTTGVMTVYGNFLIQPVGRI